MTVEFQRRVYDQHYAGRAAAVRDQLSHPLFADFYARLAARVLDAAPAGRDPVRILETGCGEGLLAVALRRAAERRGLGLDYTGADLSAAAVELAATLAPGTYVAGDAATVAVQLPGARFDVVVAKNLLHHLDDPAAFLRGAADLTAAGGRVLAVEATRGSPQAWLFSVLAPRRERLFFTSGRARNRAAFADAGLHLAGEEVFSWLPYELLFAIRFGAFRRLLSAGRTGWVRRVARADDALARRLPATASYCVYTATTEQPAGDPVIAPFLEPALRALPAGSRVLDLGCGRGFWLGRMQRAGLRPVGVDPAEEAVRGAAASAPTALADGARLPFADDAFDAVWSVHVLHHSPEPAALLREIRRVLRPGGVLLLAETVDDSPLVRAVRAVWPSWDGVPVRSRFRADDLLAMVARAGLGVESQQRHSAVAITAWVLPARQLRVWARLRRFEDSRRGAWVRRWAAHVEVIARAAGPSDGEGTAWTA